MCFKIEKKTFDCELPAGSVDSTLSHPNSHTQAHLMTYFPLTVLFCFSFQDGRHPGCEWKRRETSPLHRNHRHPSVLQVIIAGSRVIIRGPHLYISYRVTQAGGGSQITIRTN